MLVGDNIGDTVDRESMDSAVVDSRVVGLVGWFEAVYFESWVFFIWLRVYFKKPLNLIDLGGEDFAD